MNGFIGGGNWPAGLTMRGVPCDENDARWLGEFDALPSCIDSRGLTGYGEKKIPISVHHLILFSRTSPRLTLAFAVT